MVNTDNSGGERFERAIVLSEHCQAPARMVHEVVMMPSYESPTRPLLCDEECEETLGKVVVAALDKVPLRACTDDPQLAYLDTVANVRAATTRLAESAPLAVHMKGAYSYAFSLRRRVLKNGDIWSELVARPQQGHDRPSAVVAVWDFEGFMHHPYNKRSQSNGTQADYKKYLTTVVETVRSFSRR